MSLESSFDDRWNDDLLTALTNLGAPEAKTPDLVYLALIARDFEGDFSREMGVTYDDGNVKHRPLGMRGLMILLKYLKDDTDDARMRYDFFLNDLRDKHRKTIGSNQRIQPKSTSKLTPAKESEGGEIRRPGFDPNSTTGTFVPNLRDNQNTGRRGFSRNA